VHCAGSLDTARFLLGFFIERLMFIDKPMITERLTGCTSKGLDSTRKENPGQIRCGFQG